VWKDWRAGSIRKGDTAVPGTFPGVFTEADDDRLAIFGVVILIATLIWWQPARGGNRLNHHQKA